MNYFVPRFIGPAPMSDYSYHIRSIDTLFNDSNTHKQTSTSREVFKKIGNIKYKKFFIPIIQLDLIILVPEVLWDKQ